MKALYVTDRPSIGDRRFASLLEALAGTPSLAVELREKDATDRDYLAWACLARQKLGAGVLLYVNRRFDIALAAGADGVHLPANGLPLKQVRTHTPRGFRIGISTHSPQQARSAIEQGADLVLIGPIFDTPAKRPYGKPLGPEVLRELPLRPEHSSEVFAIGGIEEETLPVLDPFGDRICGVAGIRLFQEAEDPRGVAERISRR